MSIRAFVLHGVFSRSADHCRVRRRLRPRRPCAVTRPAGRLTSTDGKMIFPFFYGSKVGDACNPFVDYNCEASEATIKAAQDAAAKSGKCDPYLDYKCLDTYLGDDVATRFFRYYQLEWGKAGRAERSECAAVGPRRRRLAEIAGFDTADAVCRLPLRWLPYYRDYSAQLGRQPVHGGDREYGARQMAAGRATSRFTAGSMEAST